MVAGTHLSLPMTSVSNLFMLACHVTLISRMLTSHLRHSRAAIKKYVLANNKSLANSSAVFDAQFNKAIRSGVEKGEFHLPKGKPLFYAYFVVLALLLQLHVSSISWVFFAFRLCGTY